MWMLDVRVVVGIYFFIDYCDIEVEKEIDFYFDWIFWGFMYLLLVILNMLSIRGIYF